MALKNKYTENNNKLKKLGISPTKNKKNFSTQEKRNISRLYNKYKHEADLAAKPRKNMKGTEYTISSRELKNKKEIKLAKNAGHVVYKDKIFIKHATNEKMRLKRSKTKFSDGEEVLQIELKKRTVRRDIQIAEKYDLLKFLENQGKEKLPRGVKITVAVGNDSPFMTRGSISTSYNDLLNYISNWQPKDAGKMSREKAEKLRLELIGQMTIVTIK